MKKSILVTAAVLLTLTAFAYAKWDKNNTNKHNAICASTDQEPEAPLPLFLPKPADLYYDLGTRFKPMKKSEINKSLFVQDFLNLDYNWPIKTVEDVNIILIKEDKHTNIQFASYGENLSKEQIQFLKSCTHSTNIKLMSRCMVTDRSNQNAQWLKCTEHISIVPEHQASYSLGKEAFIKHLKEGNKKNAYGLDNDKLGFAKLYFTVNKNGSISDLELDRSSGYEKLDKAMFELLKNTPGNWTPAVNVEGETVEQELVISFGKGGC